MAKRVGIKGGTKPADLKAGDTVRIQRAGNRTAIMVLISEVDTMAGVTLLTGVRVLRGRASFKPVKLALTERDHIHIQ